MDSYNDALVLLPLPVYLPLLLPLPLACMQVEAPLALVHLLRRSSVQAVRLAALQVSIDTPDTNLILTLRHSVLSVATLQFRTIGGLAFH